MLFMAFYCIVLDKSLVLVSLLFQVLANLVFTSLKSQRQKSKKKKKKRNHAHMSVRNLN